MHVRLLLAASIALGACTSQPMDAGTAGRSPSASAASASAAPTTAASAETDGVVKAPPPTKIAETDEFGYVVAVREVAGVTQIDVDRVDMLSGAEAEAAAAAAGTDVSNDYFLVNENRRVRTYAVADVASVWASIRMRGQATPTESSVDEWLTFLRTEDARTTLFHLDLSDGRVVGVEEQYLP